MKYQHMAPERSRRYKAIVAGRALSAQQADPRRGTVDPRPVEVEVPGTNGPVEAQVDPPRATRSESPYAHARATPRWDTRRVVSDRAASLGARTPEGLARIWGSEARTIKPKFGTPLSPRWLSDAAELIAWCRQERVEPARLVSALFDYARVRERQRRPWWPVLRLVRSEKARSMWLQMHASWEGRQEKRAAGSVSDAILFSKIRHARQR